MKDPLALGNEPLGYRIKVCTKYALLLSLLPIGWVALASAMGGQIDGTPTAVVIPAYLAGALVGGVALGLLVPLSKGYLGSMLVGSLVGVLASIAIGFPFVPLDASGIMGCVISGVLLGGVTGLYARKVIG